MTMLIEDQPAPPGSPAPPESAADTASVADDPSTEAPRASEPTSRRPIVDAHVVRFSALETPHQLRARLRVSSNAVRTVRRGRRDVAAVMAGADPRLLVIVGPCSIHDPAAGLEYARRLTVLANDLADDLVVVMRTYFEKPRTTIGWKGLINDPHLDGSHDIAAGLEIARRFLVQVAELDLPSATELLEPITPQYLADLITWAAIGARTSESQIHRQLASGLSMPVGFKNGTDGEVQIALDGASSARGPQSFLGIDDAGRASLVSTTGNPDTHVVLRGGRRGPNYHPASVSAAASGSADAGLGARVIIDASHANSGKDHRRQAVVIGEIAEQVAAGSPAVGGVMMESFLVEGAQPLRIPLDHDLVHGQSVTDACLSWDTTAALLRRLAAASRARRGVVAQVH